MTKTKKVLTGLGAIGITSLMLFSSVSAANITDTPKRARPNDAVHTAIKLAVTNDDYAAFKTATASMPKPQDAVEITETVFEQMVQAEKLRAAGDQAGAKAIMDKLGLKRPGGGHMKKGPGMNGNMTDAQKTALKQSHTLMRPGKQDEANAGLKKAAGIVKQQRQNKNNK